jgi:photosynthetic reaction center H subunit
MGTGAITQYVDVAQLVLYLFWIFFAGLIYYLVRENHREGYPMETDRPRQVITGWPVPGAQDLPACRRQRDPGARPEHRSGHQLAAEPVARLHRRAAGAGGQPAAAGVGPGRLGRTRRRARQTFDGGSRKHPAAARPAPSYGVSPKDTDPRGLPVVGADGEVGGTVVDLWVDTPR